MKYVMIIFLIVSGNIVFFSSCHYEKKEENSIYSNLPRLKIKGSKGFKQGDKINVYVYRKDSNNVATLTQDIAAIYYNKTWFLMEEIPLNLEEYYIAASYPYVINDKHILYPRLYSDTSIFIPSNYKSNILITKEPALYSLNKSMIELEWKHTLCKVVFEIYCEDTSYCHLLKRISLKHKKTGVGFENEYEISPLHSTIKGSNLDLNPIFLKGAYPISSDKNKPFQIVTYLNESWGRTSFNNLLTFLIGDKEYVVDFQTKMNWSEGFCYIYKFVFRPNGQAFNEFEVVQLDNFQLSKL